MEDDSRQIPNRLTMHRKLMRYSQRQVAGLLDIHVSQLSLWENGVMLPNSNNLIRLSIIYHTIPNELYFEYFQEQKEDLKAKQWEHFE